MHFKQKTPWLALALILTAVIVLGVSVYYTLFISPEIRHCKKGMQCKHEWAEKMNALYGPKTVIFGGSSCSFSIDGEYLLKKYGIPAVNMGLSAGMGATMITNYALSETRPGDTLIVAIEPELLFGDTAPTSMAVQISYAMKHPEWLKTPDAKSPSAMSMLLMLRPEASRLFTMAGKIMLGMPIFRYKASDIHASGWVTTDDRRFQKEQKFKDEAPPQDHNEGKGPQISLSPGARDLLRALQNWGIAHQVRVAYSLPWYYTAAKDKEACRIANIEFVRQVIQYMPVLKDPSLGECFELTYFADTNLHLTSQAAELRTDSLGKQLKAWDTWTEKELDALQKQASVSAKAGAGF